ncbi:hypothetical protein [Streptomyces sp. SID12488]|uniref:hypothetical protein n=1 Tax=Streptomyces sp. SID12488 TaxID=2706040 RepID=UPI0013DD4CB1|nr:hypothetical protein [Streptomyces sp. SID12488]NEA61037.1 hypothetical protein [Streptomyces sp. SID12488]
MLGFLFAGYLALVGRPLEAVNDRLQPIPPPPNPALGRAQAARSVFGMLTLASLLQTPSYKARLEMLRS